MKNNLNLTIPRPCEEKWDTFSPSTNGRHCRSCQKTVIDFTKMSDRAILEFLKNRPVPTCGRFRPDQLKAYIYPAHGTINPGFTLLKAGIVSLLLVLISKQTHAETPVVKQQTEIAQNSASRVGISDTRLDGQIVKGIVKDGTLNDPLPGVNILLKGTHEGTTTDAEGWFEFPRKLKQGDVLVFMFIGYEPQEFTVKKIIGEVIEIEMQMDVSIMGEVATSDVYTVKKGGLWSRFKKIF